MTRRPRCATVLSVLALWSTGLAPADSPKVEVDLAGYKTVETAATPAASKLAAPASSDGPPAYLGILVDPESRGDLTIADVDTDSPAFKAGVRPGDVLRKLDGAAIKDGEGMLDVLRGKSAGEALDIEVSRQDKPVGVKAILTPWSRTMSAQDRFRTGLGVQVAAVKDGEGLTIERVAPGMPAERAKLKVGEVLLKVDDVTLTGAGSALRPRSSPSRPSRPSWRPSAWPTRPSTSRSSSTPTANSDGRPGGPAASGADLVVEAAGGRARARRLLDQAELPAGDRLRRVSRRQAQPDDHQRGLGAALFSEGTYTKTNVTGQAVHGSFRDYFLEQSCGYFRAEGKVFNWLEVGKKREEYATGNRTALLTESLDKLLARDGKDALKDFDGIFFVYAGARFPGPPGEPLLAAPVLGRPRGGKRWPYFIVDEGGPRMQGLSVLTATSSATCSGPARPLRQPREPRDGRPRELVQHVAAAEPDDPRALRRLGQGEARLAQADRDRPGRQAEADPRPDRELADGSASRSRSAPTARSISSWRTAGRPAST